MYTKIWSIWILRALQVSHPDSWAHIQVPHLCSVCVCVHIHTHTHTYTPTHVKNREDTDNTPIFPSVKNNPSRQARGVLPGDNVKHHCALQTADYTKQRRALQEGVGRQFQEKPCIAIREKNLETPSSANRRRASLRAGDTYGHCASGTASSMRSVAASRRSDHSCSEGRPLPFTLTKQPSSPAI